LYCVSQKKKGKHGVMDPDVSLRPIKHVLICVNFDVSRHKIDKVKTTVDE
jgi:hypothetical protein